MNDRNIFQLHWIGYIDLLMSSQYWITIPDNKWIAEMDVAETHLQICRDSRNYRHVHFTQLNNGE